MSRQGLARQIRVLLDAQNASMVMIKMDDASARELLRDLDVAEWSRGSSQHYRGTRVTGECG